MTGGEPTRLYKYQPLDRWSLGNLVNRSLWAAKPIDLNDPFELAVRYAQLSPPNEKTLMGIIAEMLRRQGHAGDELTKLVVKNAEYLKDHPAEFREEAKKVIELWNEKLAAQQKQIGVYSLSACYGRVPQDQLLWSHYGGSHKGFVLGFEVLPENQFSLATKVVYTNLQHIDINTLEYPFVLYDSLVMKSPVWQYEDEYRLSFSEGNRCYGWPSPPVSITFGLRMPEADRLVIWNATNSISGIEYFETIGVPDRIEIEYLAITDPQSYFDSIATGIEQGSVFDAKRKGT